MIQLQHNKYNSIVLELTCNSVLWNQYNTVPFYLFNFVSQSTNQSVYFYADNISTATTAYDEFVIIETGNTSVLNLSAGTVNLFPGNTWDYFVYEMFFNFDFDSSQAFSLVDQGMVWLSGYTTYNPTTYIPANNTFTSYEPL